MPVKEGFKSGASTRNVGMFFAVRHCLQRVLLREQHLASSMHAPCTL